MHSYDVRAKAKSCVSSPPPSFLSLSLSPCLSSTCRQSEQQRTGAQCMAATHRHGTPANRSQPPDYQSSNSRARDKYSARAQPCVGTVLYMCGRPYQDMRMGMHAARCCFRRAERQKKQCRHHRRRGGATCDSAKTYEEDNISLISQRNEYKDVACADT